MKTHDKGDMAVEFADWIAEQNVWSYFDTKKWINAIDNQTIITTKQLYEIFTNETNK